MYLPSSRDIFGISNGDGDSHIIHTAGNGKHFTNYSRPYRALVAHRRTRNRISRKSRQRNRY